MLKFCICTALGGVVEVGVLLPDDVGDVRLLIIWDICFSLPSLAVHISVPSNTLLLLFNSLFVILLATWHILVYKDTLDTRFAREDSEFSLEGGWCSFIDMR